VKAEFEERGIAFPIPVLDAVELELVRREYGQLADAHGGTVDRFDMAHLYFGWAYDLARHPRVLDAAGAILGEELVIWGTLILSKPPHDEAFIAWHQDGTYAHFLNGAPALSAWIALTDSIAESGCMRVVPGSHRTKFAHVEKHRPGNLLSNGQEIAVDVDEATAVDVQLRAGEMSLHHVDIVHGSNPNRSSWERTGFIVRYSTPQILGTTRDAVPARGPDPPRPSLPFAEALATKRKGRYA
jgi:hypothetical protein